MTEPAWNYRFKARFGKQALGVGQGIPFFAFSPEVRKVIYTIESVNARLRKIIRLAGISPATARPPR